MSKYYIRQSIAALLLVLCISTDARAPSPTPSPASVASVSAPQSQPDAEVIALRAQLELMRQYDQRLLNTVYYALTALGGVVVLVLGLGWYTNFRLYKHDIDVLRQELKVLLNEEVNKFRQELKNEVDEHREPLTAASREAVNAGTAELREEITKIGYGLTHVEFAMRIREARDREGKNDFEGAIHGYLLILKDTLSYEEDFREARAISLEGVQRVLVKAHPSAELASNIIEITDQLPRSYSADVINIRKLVEAGRAQNFQRP